MSSLSIFSSNLMMKKTISLHHYTTCLSITTKASSFSQSFNTISVMKSDYVAFAVQKMVRQADEDSSEVPLTSPPEFPTVPPVEKPPSIPLEMPQLPNVPDFDPIPLENPADPPPLSPGPNPGPEFPGPPNPSPPKPEGPRPPGEPEVIPPHGPEIIPPKPPEPGPPDTREPDIPPPIWT